MEILKPQGRPIWLAALAAVSCRARGCQNTQPVAWQIGPDYAFFRNNSHEPLHIDCLDVVLEQGHSVKLQWKPGDTGYTVSLDGVD